MPFGLQPIHLILIAIVALLIFGPSRLPEIGRGVGKALTEFRRGTREMTEGFKEEVSKPVDQPQPAGVATQAQPSAASASPYPQPTAASANMDFQPAAENSEAAQPVKLPESFCNQCGAPNPADAHFCSKCGAKIGV